MEDFIEQLADDFKAEPLTLSQLRTNAILLASLHRLISSARPRYLRVANRGRGVETPGCPQSVSEIWRMIFPAHRVPMLRLRGFSLAFTRFFAIQEISKEKEALIFDTRAIPPSDGRGHRNL